MKLYRLGENEIRIHLTGEDLEAYSITLDDFDYDSTKGRRVIWELFDRAREETGFDAAKEKVYIQLYPKESGGCELFVTKLEKEDDERVCFLFSGSDNFLSALSLFSLPPVGASYYRDREGDRDLRVSRGGKLLRRNGFPDLRLGQGVVFGASRDRGHEKIRYADSHGTGGGIHRAGTPLPRGGVY